MGFLLLGHGVLPASEGPVSGCAPQADPKPAACCPAEPLKLDACCAEIENRKSISPGAGRATDPARAAARNGEIENFSAESLYQLDAGFTDDTGRPFSLGALRGRPVVLTMFFASCGYACPLLVTDMQAIRAKLPAELRARAALVLVSFDTVRDTPAALAKYRADRHLDGQWTLLHGDDDAVRELAALLGVKYKREADGMFAHSNLITILNAEGEIVHQRNGLRGGLDETAAVLAALP
ncbi:MAG: SCO family protein [Verrucomicrobiota bacterium]